MNTLSSSNKASQSFVVIRPVNRIDALLSWCFFVDGYSVKSALKLEEKSFPLENLVEAYKTKAFGKEGCLLVFRNKYQDVVRCDHIPQGINASLLKPKEQGSSFSKKFWISYLLNYSVSVYTYAVFILFFIFLTGVGFALQSKSSTLTPDEQLQLNQALTGLIYWKIIGFFACFLFYPILHRIIRPLPETYSGIRRLMKFEAFIPFTIAIFPLATGALFRLTGRWEQIKETSLALVNSLKILF